jgi:hypothetical protein
MYNLTPTQQALLRSIVEKVRAKQMPEEFTVIWGLEGAFLHYEGATGFHPIPKVTKGALHALAANVLLHLRTEPGDKSGDISACTLTGKAYEGVDANFAAPDTSFVRHLTPLADITALDS